MIGSLFLGWAAPPASFSVPCHLKYEAPVLFWPLGYNFGGLAFLAIFDSLNFFRLKIDQKAAQQTEKLTLFFFGAFAVVFFLRNERPFQFHLSCDFARIFPLCFLCLHFLSGQQIGPVILFGGVVSLSPSWLKHEQCSRNVPPVKGARHQHRCVNLSLTTALQWKMPDSGPLLADRRGPQSSFKLPFRHFLTFS